MRKNKAILFLFSKFIFCVIFLSQPNFILGQVGKNSFEKDSLLAIEYFNIADTSFMDVPKCLKFNQMAIPLLKKTSQWEKYVYCLNAQSYCYNKLELFDEMGKNNLFAFEEAKRLLPPKHSLFFGSINNLAYVYGNLKQDFKKAKEFYKEAIFLYRDVPNDSISLMIKGALHDNLGYVLKANGEFSEAIIYYQEAVKYFSLAYPDFLDNYISTPIRVATTKEKIAEAYADLGYFDKAIKIMVEVLPDITGNKKADNNYYINHYTYLAEIYFKNNDLDKAKRLASNINEQFQLKPLQRSRLLEVEGEIAVKKNNNEKAIKYFASSMALLSENRTVSKAILEKNIGNAYLKDQKHHVAIDHFDKSIILLGQNIESFYEKTGQIKFDEIISEIPLMETLNLKADALIVQYDIDGNEKKLNAALRSYLMNSKISDNLRINYQTEKAKLFLLKSVSGYLNRAISLSKFLFSKTGNKKYLENAFFFSEKSKASVLLDELQQKEAGGISQLPDEIIQRQYQLRVDINFNKKILEKEKANENNKEKTDKAEEKIFNLRQQQERLKDSIRQEYPHYFDMSQGKPIELKPLQEKLKKENTILVEYFYGEDSLYIFKISGKRYRFDGF